MELVIARYNEPLLWLLEEPFRNLPNTIYNKGSDNKFIRTNKTVKVVNLPNVGRESESYLQHILLRYDSLSQVTLFLPGSLDSNGNKLQKALFIIHHMKMTSTFIGIHHLPSLKTDLYDFILDYWASRTDENVKKNAESKLTPSHIRPYGKWYEHHFNHTKVHVAPYGGVFSVAKQDIIQHPITRYETLIKDLQVSSNPEVGHYFERSWAAVFHPLGKNTVYISTSY
jgi:hypothetical protein